PSAVCRFRLHVEERRQNTQPYSNSTEADRFTVFSYHQGGIPMGGITSAITTLQSELLTIVVPIAVVSVILWFVANALAPVLPEWAQSMRGHFQKVMLGVML